MTTSRINAALKPAPKPPSEEYCISIYKSKVNYPPFHFRGTPVESDADRLLGGLGASPAMAPRMRRRLPSAVHRTSQARTRTPDPHHHAPVRQGTKAPVQSSWFHIREQGWCRLRVMVSHTHGRPPCQPSRVGSLHFVQERPPQPGQSWLSRLLEPFLSSVPRSVRVFPTAKQRT